jgi:hypothetical protein
MIMESSVADVAVRSQAKHPPQVPQDGAGAMTQRESPTTDSPPPGLTTGPPDMAGPPGEGDRGSRAPWRGVPAMVAVAAVVIAIVVGGMGVWLWPRGNAGAGPTGSTTGASHPASGSSSPSPTVTRPLFVWQTIAGPTAKTYGGAAAVAAYEDEIWVAGGMGRTVRVFDPATKHWRNGPPLPVALTHGALVSDGQRLYFVGGLNDPGGVQGLQTVYRLDSPHGMDARSPLSRRFSGAAVRTAVDPVRRGESVSHRRRRRTYGHRARRWVGMRRPEPPRTPCSRDRRRGHRVVRSAALTCPRPHRASAEVDRLTGSSVALDGSPPSPYRAGQRRGLSVKPCAIGGTTAQPNELVRPAVATVTCWVLRVAAPPGADEPGAVRDLTTRSRRR